MKTLWFSWANNPATRNVPFDPAINETSEFYHFLFWNKEGGVLIAGDTFNHKQLAKFADAAGAIPNENPDGAGFCHNGLVTEWFSTGFSIDTPDEYKPSIKRALGVQ